jgi:hypothetical protein
MNAGIITKIEYKIEGGNSYTPFGFTFFSASYISEINKSAAGHSYHTEINLKIAKTGKTNQDTLVGLVGRKLYIKFTDGNGRVHKIENPDYLARLTYRTAIQGEAGGWNGYDVTITCDSAVPVAVADS